MHDHELERPIFTGERVVPDDPTCHVTFLEHVARYCFAQQFVRGLRVLDAACGLGYGTTMLAQAGARGVTGIDVDYQTVEYARKRYGAVPGVRFIRASVRDLTEMVRDPIDLCVSFETIEHLEEPESFLRDVRQILVRSGLLIISTPNRYLCSPCDIDGFHPANHFHRTEWTVSEFLSLLSCCFEVESVYGQVLWPLRRARLYHWKHRIKRKVPETLLASRLNLVWRPLTSPVREPDASDLDQRDRVRPFSDTEMPLFIVCVCRRHD